MTPIKILELVQAGKGVRKHIAQLQRIAADVKDGGMCKKGKDHADILAAFLKDHAAVLERHIQGVCTAHECSALVTYMINPELCTMCDKCKTACKDFAIEGQMLRRRQDRIHTLPDPAEALLPLRRMHQGVP